jgi:hypothetical protein
MINLLFYLKFKSQLRRTRPDIIRKLDESITHSIYSAGGKISENKTIIQAVFNENTIGFFLDMYILIENVKKEIESNNDFFGYTLVIGSELPNTSEKLCSFLANPGGTFIYKKNIRNFVPYVSFEKPHEWLNEDETHKYDSSNFYRIKELKEFRNTGRDDYELHNEILRILKQEKEKNILILGQPDNNIRSGLYKYCKNLNYGFPPLTICFNDTGIGAFVDIWSLSIRSICEGEHELYSSTDYSSKITMEEIDNLWELLFRERLRDEVSNYVIRCLNRFLCLVYKYYINAAMKKKFIPVLVLENIHLAGNTLTEILYNSLTDIVPVRPGDNGVISVKTNFSSVSNKNIYKLIILGTGEDSIAVEKLRQWELIFNNIKKIGLKNNNEIFYPRLSTELWEIVFAISTLSHYFPPELFQKIFEENELNPVMITRAFSILHKSGIIDNLREPKVVNVCFEENAKKLLNEGTKKIKKLVYTQILNWTEKRNINPCFRMLVIISDMEGSKQIDDILLLKSILSDIINETIKGIETAIKSGQFERITSIKANAIRYIFNTLKALHTGNFNDIENAFNNSRNEDVNNEYDQYPVLKTQILINLSAYYLGKHDTKEAAERAKESIFIGQAKNAYCLPQAYRIYALVCLAKQQITETIEYLGFAVTNAEKINNYHETAISAYYLAAAYFLYGDINNSAKYADKSIKQSLETGRTEWADLSRFLEGRIEQELGNYKKALKIYESIHTDPFGNISEDKSSLLAAWIYRCKIYIKDYNNKNISLTNNDAKLFEIEAAFLCADYKKAIELSYSYKNPFSDNNFLFTEQVDWKSGFSQCEHLYFSNGEIEDRLNCMFHSLALSYQKENKNEEALEKIQHILRDEKLCEIDPWNAFYFYAKYRILYNTSDDVVDMSTAVSMAFKRLQRRAGRIEDIETRRQYLNGAYWNKELSLTAREFKLI